jgi:hypothetical protein
VPGKDEAAVEDTTIPWIFNVQSGQRTGGGAKGMLPSIGVDAVDPKHYGGEVLYALQRSREETGRDAAMSVIDQLPISLIAPDRAQTTAAAGLKAQHPVAYADCFGAALAIARKARLVTGAPESRRLEKDIPIDWLSR